jgi:hypothetical protein
MCSNTSFWEKKGKKVSNSSRRLSQKNMHTLDQSGSHATHSPPVDPFPRFNLPAHASFSEAEGAVAVQWSCRCRCNHQWTGVDQNLANGDDLAQTGSSDL